MKDHRNSSLKPLPMIDSRDQIWAPLPGADAWYSTCWGEQHEAPVPVAYSHGHVEIMGVSVAVRGPGGVEHGVPLSAREAEEVLRHLGGGHPISDRLRSLAQAFYG